MKISPHFIFYLTSDWESYHRPEMIRAFARQLQPEGARVLLIDRLMCPVTGPMRGLRCPLGGPARGMGKWTRIMMRWALRRDPITQLAENLYLGRAVIALDDRYARRIPQLMALNRHLLARQVDAMIHQLGLGDRPLVTWFHHPFWEHYSGIANEHLRIYECYDQHVAAGHLEATLVREAERQLFTKVDQVFTTSQALYEDKRPCHARVHLVPNAANVDFFGQVLDPERQVDSFCAALPHPVVGCLGNISHDLDLALLRYLAETHPDWSLLLVGKVEQRHVALSADFQALACRPNVHLAGWASGPRLLELCKAFDVCVIAYRRDSEFNRFRNPNKLYEYTAMGKPVVVLEGVEVGSYRHLIHLARTREEFVAAIDAAWRTDSPEGVAERLRFARANSWDSRVRTMIDIVRERLDEKVGARRSTQNAGHASGTVTG